MTYQLELGFGSVHHVEMDFNSNGSLLVTSKPSGRLAIVFETSTGAADFPPWQRKRGGGIRLL